MKERKKRGKKKQAPKKFQRGRSPEEVKASSVTEQKGDLTFRGELTTKLIKGRGKK